MTEFPPRLPERGWLILTQHPGYGLHHAGPDTPICDPVAAYDWFTEAVEDGQPVAVLEIDFRRMSMRDATDDFADRLDEVCMTRGLDRREVLRFAAPAIQEDAAE